MKYLKTFFIIISMFLFLLPITSLKSEAYVVTIDESNKLDTTIIDFNFLENGKILHDGDYLHIDFKVKNYPIMDHINVVFNTMDIIDSKICIPCYYSSLTGKYEGNIILEPKYAEWTYCLFGFQEFEFWDGQNTNPCAYSSLDADVIHSFLYNNNCYNNIHELINHYGASKCKVCGTIIKIPEIKLYTYKLTISKGRGIELNKFIKYKNKDDEIFRAISSNENIAIAFVNPYQNTGSLYLHKTGRCKLTIYMKSGASATVDITVVKDPVKVLINKDTLSLVKGKTSRLKATRTPEAFYDKISWVSSNPQVASVDKDGKVTAKTPGTTIIKAKSEYNAMGLCKVKVIEPIKKMSFLKQSINISKRKTYSLKLKITPKTSNESLVYSSSDPSIVTVDKNGKIKAKKKGTAIITVKSERGKKAKCKVKVK